ncbi:CotH kinase family protein [Paenibacillus sp. KN14-4R]|uniref:CotH kinase family protein n=1 Tax=Paenibacillus sp. KN14-4R TaxID=3445773 RepID=UPI003FA150E3
MVLPVYHIKVSQNVLAQLQKDVWSNTFVPAFIMKNGRSESIRIRYRGGHTRDYPKKSYEIITKNKRIHLNAEYDDPSMIRNALSFYFFEQIGVPSPKTRHCQVMMNGESLGVYLEIEAVDRQFFNRRHIAVQSLMYAVNENANFDTKVGESQRPKYSLFDGYKLMMGKDRDRQHFKLFISQINQLHYRLLKSYLAEKLDVNNYLLWLAGAVLTGNYDGFDQNYAFYRHQTKGFYRIIPWDYEGTWGRNCYGRPRESNLVHVMGYNFLTKRVLDIPSYRKKYKKILTHLLNTHFTLVNIEPIINQMYDRISSAIANDSTRKWSIFIFEQEPEMIKNYIISRRIDVLQALSKL